MRTLSRTFDCIGLRSLLGLAAAGLLVVQGVSAMSESASGGADQSCRSEGAELFEAEVSLTSGPGPSCLDADDSSLMWWSAVLEEEEPGDPLSPTWWDLLLRESMR